MKTRVLAALAASAALLAAACTATQGSGSTARASATKTLLPDAAWNCGMPEGIPVPEDGVLLLQAEIRLDNVYDVGRTPFGQRKVAVTQEGTMQGPRITAKVLPGGLDFDLGLANGGREVEQILVLQTSDNGYAIMRNAGTGVNGDDVRIVYDFEAPKTGG